MFASVAQTGLLPSRSLKQRSVIASPSELRALLVAGCGVSVATALWWGEPSASLRTEADLVFLLRGMAAIKACIVAAAVGAVLWRLGHAIPGRTAAAYLVGCWLMASATVLVWQLSLVPLAAACFHTGELLLLFTAWRDRGAGMARLRRTA